MTAARHGMSVLLLLFLGAVLALGFWLNVRESVLHPRTSRFAYDVEAP